MVELKVQCDCGQRYKFDVEPANQQMPYAVACPICGRDGTGQANHLLAQMLPAAPVGVPLAAAGPASFSAQATSTAPAAGLRINRAEPEPPSAAATPFVSSPAAAVATRSPGSAAAAVPGKKPSFGLGLLGAFTGALIGSLIYFALFKYAGLQFKLIAVAVGFLAGAGAEWLGRKEGSNELGLLAATFSLIGIVGAQYFVARSWWMADSHQDTSTQYAESVAEAKKVVAVIPNGSDQEIRLYLAKEEADPGEKPNLEAVPIEAVQEFRQTELSRMRDLASGTITKEKFEQQLKLEAAAEHQTPADKESEEGTFKAVFLLLLLSKFNLVSMAASAGLAYKLCANA